MKTNPSVMCVMSLYTLVLEGLDEYVEKEKQYFQHACENNHLRLDMNEVKFNEKSLRSFEKASTPLDWLLNHRAIRKCFKQNIHSNDRISETFDLLFEIAGVKFGKKGKVSIWKLDLLWFMVDHCRYEATPKNLEELCGIIGKIYHDCFCEKMRVFCEAGLDNLQLSGTH